MPEAPLGESRYDRDTAAGRTVDESEETGLRYMNPSVVVPLEQMWVAKRQRPDRANGSNDDDGEAEGA